MPYKNISIEIKKQELECTRLRKIYDYETNPRARETAAKNWEEARELLRTMRIQNGEEVFI